MFLDLDSYLRLKTYCLKAIKETLQSNSVNFFQCRVTNT